MRWRTTALLLCAGAVVLLSWRFLYGFFAQSLQEGYSSQSVLVPFITAYLIWTERKKIFSKPAFSLLPGLAITLAGIAFYVGGSYGEPQNVGAMAAKLMGVLLLIVGAFIALYGTAAFRAAIFPLFLLLLMMPLPPTAVDKVIVFLQWQSATLSYHLFSLLGVPVYRDGVLLTVPGITIEVAKECSGINSSVALLLTALLVAWQTLRSTSRRIILVLLTVPLSILKNAVRIVTLTLLALYVDPSFLTGRLHHQGGFVFFVVALGLIYPVWKVLQKTERVKPVAELAAQPVAVPGLPH
jgi:exosortase